jgi:hypothetical protein
MKAASKDRRLKSADTPLDEARIICVGFQVIVDAQLRAFVKHAVSTVSALRIVFLQTSAAGDSPKLQGERRCNRAAEWASAASITFS